jgi:choline-sulfatase
MPKKPKPFSEEAHPHLRWWRQVTNTEDVSEAEAMRVRAAYWALVAEVDAMIGQILTALENNGLLDNTLIVYTSDHGDMLGEHGLWWKHTFYEESAKVPLIMSWPGVIPAGQRCGNVVSALDVTATILDALGAPALPNAAGRSFLDLVNGTETKALWEDEAFTEYCSDEYAPQGGCYQRMVRRGDWKLIYYDGQPPQLFNLAEDPDELTDRAGDPACQEIQQALTERVLDGWDPRAIKAKMDAKRADNQILKAWARRTHPEEQYRWDLRPEMSRLEI